MRNELEADTDDKAAGNSRTHIAFRKVWKTVAVAAITLTLLFSTCMVANAQFRERVISWVIETFEKYSIFELHGDELDELQDLTEYQAGYLPDGAILQDIFCNEVYGSLVLSPELSQAHISDILHVMKILSENVMGENGYVRMSSCWWLQ